MIASLAVLVVLGGTMKLSLGGTGAESGKTIVIHMLDYRFQPAHMIWHVGETVTVTLVNDSVAHPGKPHEWMVGRTPNSEDTVFGRQVTDGFKTDFFDGVDITIVGGTDLTMLMAGGAHLSGKSPMSVMKKGPMGPMEEMTGFMPVMSSTGRLTISFKVPDKPGDWTYGCFQQSGQHFLNGMHGTITVVGG
ncbi:MAG: hypothetical protein GC186_19995 [Rhodobacteraceae bacterium]|nr:hypothetical protein [Paracoccaceae bacterium]